MRFGESYKNSMWPKVMGVKYRRSSSTVELTRKKLKQCWCVCMYVQLRCTFGAPIASAVHKSWWSGKGPIQTGWSSKDKANAFVDQGDLPDQKVLLPFLRTILNHIEAWKSFVIYIRAIDFSLMEGNSWGLFSI